jgi:tripartite-type tricarboxylate transporter receptor subunit TctC
MPIGRTMKLPRRTFLHFAGTVVGASALSPVAWTQTYPTRPITMIVPLAAGGPTDTVGRVIAEAMSKSLGQPIIVENVTGADGTIGVGRVARAKPDGYTLCLGSISTNALNGAIYSLQYNVLKDFAPVAPLVTSPYVIFARKTLPANDLNELIAWLKANRERASAGISTVTIRLAMVWFQRETGTDFAIVPYRGAAPAIQELVAGHIDLAISTADGLPLVRAGSIKAYAVTSDLRSPLAPDIATVAELGLPGLTLSAWFGLFAPKSTATRRSACFTRARPSVRCVLCSFAFLLVPGLGSTGSAAYATDVASALFVGFAATMAECDFSRSFIIGYGSSPSRHGPTQHAAHLVVGRP